VFLFLDTSAPRVQPLQLHSGLVGGPKPAALPLLSCGVRDCAAITIAIYSSLYQSAQGRLSFGNLWLSSCDVTLPWTKLLNGDVGSGSPLSIFHRTICISHARVSLNLKIPSRRIEIWTRSAPARFRVSASYATSSLRGMLSQCWVSG
jgi:hypothetical protein